MPIAESPPAESPDALEWYGGLAGARLRARRGDIDELPWGTLETRALDPALVRAARDSYAEGAWREYRTAVAFGELSRALLLARAPIDLTAMCVDFVVDEMTHVELNARMAMELADGATPTVRGTNLAFATESADPIERAAEIAVRVSCVGETLSAPLLAAAAREATHPLTVAVLHRLAADEAPHAAAGFIVLSWAAPRLDAGARKRLARIAEHEVAALFDDWRGTNVGSCACDEAERDFGVVGFPRRSTFLAQARRALRRRVARPLARFGIDLDPKLLDRLAPA
jgi:hypothetical protein